MSNSPNYRLQVIRSLFITVMAATIFPGCDNLKRLETKELVKMNPTEHTFNVPLENLKQTILSSFNQQKGVSSPLYRSSVFYFFADRDKREHKITVLFNAETEGDALAGKEHFAKPNTENDIYVHSFGTPWYSPIYFAGGRALEFRTAFILTLEKIDEERTLLKVSPETPRVLKGVEGLTAHGFYSKEIDVAPTTVEEYTLILFIAEQLGDTTLAPLTINTK